MKYIIYKVLAIITMLACLTGCRTDNTISGSDASNTASTEENNEIRVNFLNVGKADCIAIEIEDKLIMIDTGTTESIEVVDEYLELKGYDTIDMLFITHFDKDHVGGAAHLIENYNVGKVITTFYEAKVSDEIDNYHAALEEKGITPDLVSSDETLNVGDVSFAIYPPQQTEYEKDTSNNSSLVIRMVYGNTSFLFAGDAQKERINELLEIPDLRSDVLKIPHHGNLKKNSEDLIDYIDPDYAVITCSDEEPEDEELVELLENREITTYLTRDGMVSITSDGETLSVSQFVFM